MTDVVTKTLSGLKRLPNLANKAFRDINPCCVYIVGIPNQMPVKIGIASDVSKRFQTLRSSTWLEIELIAHFWFASSMLARQIEQDTHAIMDKAKKRARNEWFNVNSEWAENTIRFCAAKRRYAVYSYEEVVSACMSIAHSPPQKGLANRILPAIREIS